MLLAYINHGGAQSASQELCIIPDKLDPLSVPVPVTSIKETTAAVYRVGPGETFIARREPSDNSLVLDSLKPAKIFLTQDRSDQPGFSVQRLKILQSKDGLVISYQREKSSDTSWIKWDPLSANLN